MLSFVFFCASAAFAQETQPENLEHLYQLRDQGAWQQILDLTSAAGALDAEHRFLRGLALAHLGHLPEAEAELKQAAGQMGKRGGKILIELAGVQFKQKRFSESARNLRRAVSLGESDPYVFDFLASLYYLDGNLEAAIKYWNRVGKPDVQELKVEPDGILDPVLLNRALAISPASELKLPSLRLTELRLEMLDVFARRRYDLSARQDGQFDLTVQTAEKADLRAGSAFRSLAGVARELPFQTVHADLRNIGRSAVNWSSAFRWKLGNRLFASRLAAPVGHNPNLLYHAGVEVRDEEWDLSAWTEAGGLTSLRLVATGAGITSIAGERWVWSTGFTASHRDLVAGRSPSPHPDSVRASGFALASTWGARYRFLDLPEKRMQLSGEAQWELGRFWSSQAALFNQGEVALKGSWEAQKHGRLLVTAQAQAGTSGGSIPFDRLFRLGMDRDSNLLLRGHSGTRNGLKGDGPMGGGYLLVNADLQKRLYGSGLLSLSAGPFVDSGRILEPRSRAVEGWMLDTGFEGRLALLGLFQVALSYGIDTGTGNRLTFWRVLTH
ncbi:MAG: hypothetical protein ACE15E_04855 [Acidobacteriota bacterium]